MTHECLLLAPTGAIVLMMVYYTSIRPFFHILSIYAFLYCYKCHSKGSPILKNVWSIWALPKWGVGGSRPLPEWFGALNFEKNCPCSNGLLLGLGGMNPCQDGLGHLCSENWSSNGIFSSRSGNEVHQSACSSKGGGVGNRYLGNAQIDPTFVKLGLP